MMASKHDELIETSSGEKSIRYEACINSKVGRYVICLFVEYLG